MPGFEKLQNLNIHNNLVNNYILYFTIFFRYFLDILAIFSFVHLINQSKLTKMCNKPIRIKQLKLGLLSFPYEEMIRVIRVLKVNSERKS